AADNRTYVWDMTTHSRRAVLEGHQRLVIRLMFNHAGDLLASASWDGTSRLWDPDGGRSLVQVPGMALRFSGDDRRLAFTDQELVGWWDVTPGAACRLLYPDSGLVRPAETAVSHYLGVDISPGGDRLAAATWDGAHVWDLGSGREVAHLEIGSTGAARFHPDGDRLLTYGPGGLRLWPPPTGPGGRLEFGPARDLQSRRNTTNWHEASWDPDGRRLAVDSPDLGQVVILDPDAPEKRTAYGTHPWLVTVTLSPDGRWVAGGTWQGDGVKVWDRGSGKVVAGLPGSRRGAGSARVAFSPDSRWLVVSGQGEIRSFHTDSWQPGWVLPRDRLVWMPGVLAFSRDGQWLAVARELKRVQLIDTATGQPL